MIPKVVLLLYEVGQNVGVVTHCLRKKHFKVTKARAAMVDNWLRVSEGTWSQFRLQEPIPASGASRSGPKKFGNAKPLSHLGNQKRELCPSVGE